MVSLTLDSVGVLGSVKMPFLCLCYAKDIFWSLMEDGIGWKKPKWIVDGDVACKKENLN